MKKRLLVAAGFCVGLVTAGLLNPTAHSRMANGLRVGIPAIAVQLTASSKLFLSPSTPQTFAAIPALSTNDSCSDNDSARAMQAAHREHLPVTSVSLLNHVPTPQQRLDWYSLTRKAAISNAPRRSAPKPATIHWHSRLPEPVMGFADACAGAAGAIAESQVNSGSMGGNAMGLSQLAQAKRSLLQQQSHFILSLVTLTQESDWLLKPSPAPTQVVHTMWRSGVMLEE